MKPSAGSVIVSKTFCKELNRPVSPKRPPRGDVFRVGMYLPLVQNHERSLGSAFEKFLVRLHDLSLVIGVVADQEMLGEFDAEVT